LKIFLHIYLSLVFSNRTESEALIKSSCRIDFRGTERDGFSLRFSIIHYPSQKQGSCPAILKLVGNIDSADFDIRIVFKNLKPSRIHAIDHDYLRLFSVEVVQEFLIFVRFVPAEIMLNHPSLSFVIDGSRKNEIVGSCRPKHYIHFDLLLVKGGRGSRSRTCNLALIWREYRV